MVYMKYKQFILCFIGTLINRNLRKCQNEPNDLRMCCAH